MTLAEFEASGSAEIEGALLALWWDRRGDWDQAHEIAQEMSDADGAWVHAYLHRKRGDGDNAAYWYARAGRPVAGEEPRHEWERMVEELLQRR